MLPQNMGGAVGGAPHNGTTSNHGAHVASGSSRGGADRSGGDSNHRGVQRSISASASSKTRKGSTSTDPNNAAVIGKNLTLSKTGVEKWFVFHIRNTEAICLTDTLVLSTQ